MRRIVEVEAASFTYTIRNGRARSLKDAAVNAIRGISSDVQVQALKDVSFTIEQGEVLAVIGRNGAGKSTLLKLLSKVLPPTSGVVRIQGDIAPMIELGAGFNPELTGSENILLFGVILGNSTKEMKSKIEEITEWAGLQEQINLPVRTYSTGMVARLGFAVATFRTTELLIIDEVLAVGDADFKKKSSARVQQLISEGEATVLVSHDLDAVERMATKVLWLDHGQQMALGTPKRVLRAYRASQR
jgi:ABC-type polysaccharide/polyol phosphate transport system ATPase subunit